MRTGQPGIAPERQVIETYDINDYKEKTDLTHGKLVTVFYASLRAYRDIMRLEQARFGLRRAIEAITEVTAEAGVPHPDIITESGRAVVAYYSVLVINILDINRFESRTNISEIEIHKESPALLRNLHELSKSLGDLNIPLLIRTAPHWDQAPVVLLELCRQLKIEAVHVNEEYGINEQARDRAVQQHLRQQGVNLRSCLDQLFFAPGSVLTQSGGYFQVFSQFRKVCYQRLATALPACRPLPAGWRSSGACRRWTRPASTACRPSGCTRPPPRLITRPPRSGARSRASSRRRCGGFRKPS
mgnify:CR=1 FL=1